MFTLNANLLDREFPIFDMSDIRHKGSFIGDPNRARLMDIIANLQRVGFFPFQATTEYELFSFTNINDYEPDIVYVDFVNEPNQEVIHVDFKDAT